MCFMIIMSSYFDFRHITANISECPVPILTYFTGLVGVLVGTIIQMFVWQSLETLLWQPVKFGRCSQTFHGTTFTQRVKFFALAFDNGLADRKSTFKMFSGNNRTTSCQNFVNFRLVISEFTLVKRAFLAVIRLQFDDDLHCHSETYCNIAILILVE